jgi:hypothetical protein
VKDGPAWDCDTRDYTNYAGCSITEWSRASYGLEFDAQGGGVFAMKWDENGIAVCKYSPCRCLTLDPLLTPCTNSKGLSIALPSRRTSLRESRTLGNGANPLRSFPQAHVTLKPTLRTTLSSSVRFYCFNVKNGRAESYPDITFCGDWAGNSYASTKCPGTCPERLMDPKNFEVRSR